MTSRSSAEPRQALLRLGEAVAVGQPLVALPAGADAQLHPAAADRRPWCEIILAVRAGLRNAVQMTMWPRRTRLVSAASAASEVNDSKVISSVGRGTVWKWSNSQIDSKPSRSACWATSVVRRHASAGPSRRTRRPSPAGRWPRSSWMAPPPQSWRVPGEVSPRGQGSPMVTVPAGVIASTSGAFDSCITAGSQVKVPALTTRAA